MATVSTGSVAESGDNSEVHINGSIQNPFNFSWQPSVLLHRWGVEDLKAPDIEHFGAVYRFTNMSPSIPKNAIITAASLSGGAAPVAISNGTVNTVIRVAEKDGKWDVTPNTSAQWASGDHGTYKLDLRVVVQASGPTELANTGTLPGLPVSIGVRRWGAPDRSTKLAQRVKIVTGGKLDTIITNLRKFGAPAGNIFLEVYDVSGGLPGALLATSDNLSVATIPTTFPGTDTTFAFSGADQITLSVGQDLFVSVGGDYAISSTDYITCQAGLTADYTDGYVATFGEGSGFDSQHYPIAQQMLDVSTVSGSVAWDPPSFTENVAYTTPDISTLIQNYVSDANYTEGDPICVRVERLSGADLHNRGFKSFDSPDTPGTAQLVALSVTWEPPLPNALLGKVAASNVLSGRVTSGASYGGRVTRANASGNIKIVSGTGHGGKVTAHNGYQGRIKQ